MKPWTLVAALGLGAVFLGGCGTELPASSSGNDLGGTPACTAGFATACTCQPGTVAGQQCDAAGNAFACTCSAVQNTTHPVPCEVSAVLESACWSCHGTTRQYTAPMSLVTYEDFQAPAPSNPTLKVYQVIGGRIHHATSPMPPVPNARLDATQLAAMDAWLNAGASAGTQATCGSVDPVGGAGGAAGMGGVGGVSGTGGVGGTGGTGLPEDIQCFDFLAHAQGSAEAPYSVGGGTKDAYINFTFNAPWGAGAHAVSFKSKIDNTNVIHHWLLYQNYGSVADLGVGSGSGTHGGDELVAGWAPGGTDTILPPDVGMKMGTGFTMEIHYNNAGQTATDHSGVEVCVTNTPRAKEAALHWLGTELIQLTGAGSVAGNCSPLTDRGPITILTSWPHMHLKGTHLKTEITRVGGAKEMLVDQPFSFQNQIGYETPTVIMPGDKLATTCTYNSGATFGPGTGAEMCYNFVLAYPAGALTSSSFFGGGLTSTVNHCFQ